MGVRGRGKWRWRPSSEEYNQRLEGWGKVPSARGKLCFWGGPALGVKGVMGENGEGKGLFGKGR